MSFQDTTNPRDEERDKRRQAALFNLDSAGIEFKSGTLRFLTLEQIEALAEVVKTWEG